MRSRHRSLEAARQCTIAIILSTTFTLGAGPVMHPAHEVPPDMRFGQHWGYVGDIGPARWGSLATAFGLCGRGQNQSPIDIAQTAASAPPGLVFDYKPTPLRLINNGHTIQFNCGRGSYLTIDGKKFELLQLHFHSPSEHRIAGSSFAMEAHLVHSGENGELLVVAALFKEGRPSDFIDALWNNLPANVNALSAPGISLNATDLLPANRRYYRYDGSLTTPPCSEGVHWLVLASPVEVSRGQVDRFRSLIGENARPVQPLHGRTVLQQRQ